MLSDTEKEQRTAITDRLRALRREMEMPQYRFEKYCGLAIGTVSKYESTECHAISVVTITRICDKFGLTTDWVIYGREPRMYTNADNN